MSRLRYWPVVLACLVSEAVSCLLSLHLSTHAFTGYDVSPMIDAGWRVFEGQAPSRDFIVTFPPSLYLSVAWAYRWFGVSWHAIALMECLLYAVIVVLGIRAAALVRSAWNERTAALTLASFSIGQTILLVSISASDTRRPSMSIARGQQLSREHHDGPEHQVDRPISAGCSGRARRSERSLDNLVQNHIAAPRVWQRV